MKHYLTCPRCGQGGLLKAKLKQDPALKFIICQECDTLWITDDWPQTCDQMIDLEFFMKKINLPSTWDDIIILSGSE